MGGWRLEIAKMALYITFPVALFHYFNQPQLFEEWVIKTKREIYPPENLQARRELEEVLNRIKQKQQETQIKELENNIE